MHLHLMTGLLGEAFVFLIFFFVAVEGPQLFKGR